MGDVWSGDALNGEAVAGSALSSRRQVLVMGDKLLTDGQALLILRKRGELLAVLQLLSARLDSKIGLAVGDHRLAGVAVLNDEVAGLAGQPYIWDLALCSRTNVDHTEDVLEMVIRV